MNEVTIPNVEARLVARKLQSKKWGAHSARNAVSAIRVWTQDRKLPGWDLQGADKAAWRRLRERINNTEKEELEGKHGNECEIISPEDYEGMLCYFGKDVAIGRLFRFAWHTGARPQEITGVRRGDWDEKLGLHGGFRIPRSRAKGGKKPRIILCDAEAALVARAWLRELPPDEYTTPLFRNTKGEPWCCTTVGMLFYNLRHRRRNTQRFQQPCHETLEYLRRYFGEERYKQPIKYNPVQRYDYRLYDFRHTFVTRLLRKGVSPVNVATLVGHSDMTMIMRVYSHLGEDYDHLSSVLDRG